MSSSSSSASASASITLEFQGKAAQNFKWHGRSSTTVSLTISTEAPATTSSTSTSIYVAPTSSSVVVSSTTSSSVASQSSTSSSGKRGIAYNDATLAALFEGNSEVTWGYNWGSSSSGLSRSFNYVPLLWGTADTFTSGWDDAVTTALAAGSTHLMSFNEPDDSSQSDLTPEAAAAAYKTYMQPYAGKAKLGAPAVTNGGGSMGLDWLAAFLDACDGCTIDFVAIHWYDSYSNTAYFQDQVQNASSISGNLPVWVTEFGTTDGTDAEISTFLETVMPWMDEQDYVEAYSYFMASDGLLVSGTELSSYGSTFATYTS
ncbi:glycosyl hydrolase catalytic core-domain-containing protein [Delphinella strobiligena]|nr:glycosyl hydrolase catalytic core-domain-containing protein [Delphinella strobiligena]